jgi:hypothetical protein
MWYLLSERAITDLREQASSARARLLHLMKPEEILEAQQRAGEFSKELGGHSSAFPPAAVDLEKEFAKFSTA